MVWFLYLMSILWIVTGCFYILYTEKSREKVKALLDRMDRRVIAIVVGLIGILLIISAFHARNTWFIATLGALGMAKGVLFFLNTGSIYDKLMQQYLDATSNQTFRFFGIIMLILGTALISWA